MYPPVRNTPDFAREKTQLFAGSERIIFEMSIVRIVSKTEAVQIDYIRFFL